MKITKFLFVFGCLTYLTSCIMGKQLIKLKEQETSGKIAIENVKHVSTTDQFSQITGSLGSLVAGSGKIGLGVHARHQQINTGDMDVSAVAYFKPGKNFDFYYEAEKSTTLKFKLDASYAYPIIKLNKTKEAVVPLYDKVISDSSYYTIMDVDYLNVWSLRGGVGHMMSELKSTTYAESIADLHQEMRFNDAFQDGGMLIVQGDYVGKIGLSFSRIFGTTFHAINPDHDFTGALYRKLSFYGDLQILAFAQTDPIVFSYKYLDSPMSTFVDEPAYDVDPKSFLQRKNFGFAVGCQYDFFAAPVANIGGGVFIEIGVTPGYMDRFGQGFYVETGVQMGFGKVSQR